MTSLSGRPSHPMGNGFYIAHQLVGSLRKFELSAGHQCLYVNCWLPRVLGNGTQMTQLCMAKLWALCEFLPAEEHLSRLCEEVNMSR
jgi:hypothetical protein